MDCSAPRKLTGKHFVPVIGKRYQRIDCDPDATTFCNHPDVCLAVRILIAINSFAYVQEEEKQDSETAPNRSSYCAGATGTGGAFSRLFEQKNESGYKVTRWRKPSHKLLGSGGEKVKTFVMIGRPALALDQDEAKALLLWVHNGGHLVLIDRRPNEGLLPRSGGWQITTEFIGYPNFNIDPADQKEMTRDVKAARPVQPTPLTRDVESVMPSQFFSEIKIFRATKDESKNAEHGNASDGTEESSDSLV